MTEQDHLKNLYLKTPKNVTTDQKKVCGGAGRGQTPATRNEVKAIMVGVELT